MSFHVSFILLLIVSCCFLLAAGRFRLLHILVSWLNRLFGVLISSDMIITSSFYQLTIYCQSFPLLNKTIRDPSLVCICCRYLSCLSLLEKVFRWNLFSTIFETRHPHQFCILVECQSGEINSILICPFYALHCLQLLHH